MVVLSELHLNPSLVMSTERTWPVEDTLGRTRGGRPQYDSTNVVGDSGGGSDVRGPQKKDE